MLEFHRIHEGYCMATSAWTGVQYVVRTRPRNDGWMAIPHEEMGGSVIGTGLSYDDAVKACSDYDRALREEVYA